MSNMVIRIIDVEESTATNKANKPYTVLDISYKNVTFQDKVESKKHNQYGDKTVYATLKDAKKGDVFTILREKDDAGYWQWVGIEQGENAPMAAAPNKAAPQAATAAPKSNFETPDERAKKQVYIIKQSCLGYAIESLKTDKKNPTPQEVMDLAQVYVDYVMGVNPNAVAKLPELEEDDIPY
jgi:hypothetical protein